MKKKKLLFVINTLGRGGAEQALLSILNQIDSKQYEIDLYILLGQGELIRRVPNKVHILNQQYIDRDVLSARGRRALSGTVLKDCFHHGAFGRNIRYICHNAAAMLKQHHLQIDKLFWKMISDASDVPGKTYDLAIAFLEGGATYYVSDHVQALRKAAFIHVDYQQAGYTGELDHGCYQKMDRIFCVSKDNRTSFLRAYPELTSKTETFYLAPNQKKIRKEAALTDGFTDGFTGIRILTVARLVKQKCLDLSIRAMRIYENRRQIPGSRLPEIRWYVLGEGDERRYLEEEIRRQRLEDRFILAGVRDNPYPYYQMADLYVHCTGFEGRSIALQEAMLLGRPVIASDCSGNRELIHDGENGILVPLSPEAIEEAMEHLIRHPEEAMSLGREAAKGTAASNFDEKVLSLCTENLQKE